jgi:hypothetical protein
MKLQWTKHSRGKAGNFDALANRNGEIPIASMASEH